MSTRPPVSPRRAGLAGLVPRVVASKSVVGSRHRETLTGRLGTHKIHTQNTTLPRDCTLPEPPEPRSTHAQIREPSLPVTQSPY